MRYIYDRKKYQFNGKQSIYCIWDPFFIGGIYLGTLIFLNAPETYEIDGLIETIRVEKTRSLGFEDIPIDSDNPEYADIPYETLPGEVSGKKKEGLIIGLAMSLMGLIFFSVSLWQKSRERKLSLELLDRVKKLKRQNYLPFLPRVNEILYETHNRGSVLIGVIITVIGSVFLGVGVMEIFSQGEIEMKMMLAFPTLIGLGLLYMGLSEFTSDFIAV
ncbi:MAG: hypothetical protein U9N32_07825, partial [Spirochaetota bacterium]|nr:hypothetical protein [Spirochaetota bacterium]